MTKNQKVTLQQAQEAESELRNKGGYDRNRILRSARIPKSRYTGENETTVMDLTDAQQYRICEVLGIVGWD